MKKAFLLVVLVLAVILPQSARAACTTTINLGLKICDFGDSNWHTFTNANWNLVDFSFASPLSRSGVNVTLNTVPYTKGGTSFTAYAKGDLLVGLASGALAKLAAGVDGTSLVADSSQTNGVKWAASSSRPPFSDSLTLLLDNTDVTKSARFELNGLTTATLRVFTLQDRNGTLADLGANLFTDHQTIDNQKEFRLREATGSGTNYTGFKAPTSLSANLMYELPGVDGSDGDVLTTNGAGTTSWETPSAGGGGSGVVFAGGSAGNNLSNSTTSYMPMNGNAAPSTSDCNAFLTYHPAVTTAHTLKCHLTTEDFPTSGKSWSIYVRNAASGVDVGDPCVIDDVTANICTVNGTSFEISTAYLCLKVVPSGSPTAAPIICETTL